MFCHGIMFYDWPSFFHFVSDFEFPPPLLPISSNNFKILNTYFRIRLFSVKIVAAKMARRIARWKTIKKKLSLENWGDSRESKQYIASWYRDLNSREIISRINWEKNGVSSIFVDFSPLFSCAQWTRITIVYRINNIFSVGRWCW